MSNFPERLSELMFESGYNNTDLSKATGIGETTIRDYLRGEIMPYYEKLITLADHFKCSTDFLLGLEDETYTHTFSECPPFHERIDVVLKECGKTRYSVEKACNISHSVFGYWKSGRTQPSALSLIKIAKYLERTVDYVIGRSKN